VSEAITITEDGRGDSAAAKPSFIFKADLRFRHFPELDGLRGCSVLLVVVGHTMTFKYWRGYRFDLASLGVLGFFVLSGFLITGLLCSEERRYEKISIKDFYLRRAFRILPALTVYLVTIIVLKQVGLVTGVSWRAIGYSALFVENMIGGGVVVGHLWTLSLEEQFYLAWPLVFLLVGRRKLFAPALGLIIGTWVYRAVAIWLAPWDYGQGIFEHRSDFRMDSILIGCALALFFDRRPGDRKQFTSFARWGTHPMWVLPLLYLWTVHCEVSPFLGVHLTVQTVLVCCLAFNIIVFPKSVLGAILRNPVLRFVGLVSYSLYLWNQLFISTTSPDWGFIRRVPFCIVVSMGVAVLSYYLVERPFLGLKRRFAYVR
jgi:peptidoglycan/LPS O-acetylase OafA/YrhL